MRGDRGQADLFGVFLLLIFVLISLWIFAMVGPPIIGALADVALDVGVPGYTDRVKRVRMVVLRQSPTIYGVGFFGLVILFAVFRERFLGTSRRR